MNDYIRIISEIDVKSNVHLKNNIVRLQRERKYPTKFRLPTTIQYELTSHCNLKCLHCYNRSGDNDIVTTMTIKDWVSLSELLVRNGGIFQCILSGGEPLLLGSELLSIMDILHEDGTSFVLISNGYLLNDIWIQRLKKYRFYWIQISIDGATSKYHDMFRDMVFSNIPLLALLLYPTLATARF